MDKDRDQSCFVHFVLYQKQLRRICQWNDENGSDFTLCLCASVVKTKSAAWLG
jgi:hypothetical protein